MSPALFRAGLSFSQELDRRFGVRTTAAKMTDVPGHTLGIVPLLAEAGVRFLHLGVNTASPVAGRAGPVPLARAGRRGGRGDVPELLWRDALPGRLRRGPGLRAHQGQYRAAERAADGRGAIATSRRSIPDADDRAGDAGGLCGAWSGPRREELPGGDARSATAGSTAPPATRSSWRASWRCSGSTTGSRRKS